MEVDELDPGLLEQFGSLQTVDHVDLVRQMRRLVGGEDVITESCAKFYLEMSSWNVHAAVGHYFDLNGGAGISGGGSNGGILTFEKLPSMTFLKDVTIGEGESVPPSTNFTKTWSVFNSGTEDWPSDCTLRFVHGQRLQTDKYLDRVEVKRCLRPGESMDLSLNMTSPATPGMYEARWRMASPSSSFFGDTIWVILTVEPTGTLALTQQMDRFHDLGRPQTSSGTCSPPAPSSSNSTTTVINPFAGVAAAATQRRPLSPTDREQPVVNVRNILERTVVSDLNPRNEAKAPTLSGVEDGCQDEDMN